VLNLMVLKGQAPNMLLFWFLHGMSSISTVATVQLVSTVGNVTSRLSRVAVFMHELRLEERRHEPRPFDGALETIEDHSEHGLYGILCRLHAIHRQAAAVNGSVHDGDNLATSINAALAEVQLVEATRPSHRHLRALSIICDFAQLLQRIVFVLSFPV